MSLGRIYYRLDHWILSQGIERTLYQHKYKLFSKVRSELNNFIAFAYFIHEIEFIVKIFMKWCSVNKSYL